MVQIPAKLDQRADLLCQNEFARARNAQRVGLIVEHNIGERAALGKLDRVICGFCLGLWRGFSW